MSGLVGLIQLLLQVLIFAIFARSIISWFPIDPSGPIVRTLDAITEPILQPLRRVIPRLGMIDLTPLVAILALVFISRALASGTV